MDFLIRDCILYPITPHDVLVHSSPVRWCFRVQEEEEQTFYKKDEKNDFFLFISFFYSYPPQR